MAAKYASNSLDHFPVHPMHCLQKRAYKPANNVGCRSSAVAVALVAIALASVALAAPSEPVDSGKDFSSEAPEHQAADSVKSLLQYEGRLSEHSVFLGVGAQWWVQQTSDQP